MSAYKGRRKVQSGCITCKIRKVKCDEGKPQCLRCMTTGRKCDGYLPSTLASPAPPILSLGQIFRSPREIRAIGYYCAQTGPTLSAGGIGASFWETLVLQLCHVEPVVRHALVALSLFDENFNVPCGLAQRISVGSAFQQYNAAVALLADRMTNAEAELVSLTVCIIFVCIEFLLGRPEMFHVHIHHGRSILSKLDITSASYSTIKDILAPLYTRLSLASFLSGGSPACIPQHLIPCPSVTSTFSSLEGARDVLYILIDRILRFTNEVHAIESPYSLDPVIFENLIEHQKYHLTQLSSWKSTFDRVSSSAEDQQTPKATILLWIHYSVAWIWTSTVLSGSEMSYDHHTHEFSFILDQVTLLDEHCTKENGCFSFETQVFGPLFWTAIKCRHSHIRARALHLIERRGLRQRAENFWRVEHISAVVKRIIEVEEQDAPRGWDSEGQLNVPESRRVRHVTIGPAHEKGVWLTLVFRTLAGSRPLEIHCRKELIIV